MTENLVNIQEVIPEEQDEIPQENVEEEAPENGAQQALQEEFAQLKDQLLRALAEGENIRRRAEREREETSKYAITKFSRDLLTISDTLSRALEAIPAESTEVPEAVQNFVEGIKLTEKELMSTFERYGIKKIMPLGEKFDHNLHQAMFEVESNEHEPGTVMQVLQAGYVLHDRLLRPAMVGVSKSA